MNLSGPVLIPFIAGQWSLLARCRGWTRSGPVLIPFIAGQWSLPRWRRIDATALPRLNPLHCGAVVASAALVEHGDERDLSVLIPFIAGQWSLLAGLEKDLARAQKS